MDGITKPTVGPWIREGGAIYITDADKDCVVSIEIMGDRANVNTITSLIFDTLNQLCPDIFQA